MLSNKTLRLVAGFVAGGIIGGIIYRFIINRLDQYTASDARQSAPTPHADPAEPTPPQPAAPPAATHHAARNPDIEAAIAELNAELRATQLGEVNAEPTYHRISPSVLSFARQYNHLPPRFDHEWNQPPYSAAD